MLNIKQLCNIPVKYILIAIFAMGMTTSCNKKKKQESTKVENSKSIQPKEEVNIPIKKGLNKPSDKKTKDASKLFDKKAVTPAKDLQLKEKSLKTGDRGISTKTKSISGERANKKPKPLRKRRRSFHGRKTPSLEGSGLGLKGRIKGGSINKIGSSGGGKTSPTKKTSPGRPIAKPSRPSMSIMSSGHRSDMQNTEDVE